MLVSCTQVRWRPVLWGLGLQFVLGVLIIRWKPGYNFFRYLGDKVHVFLEFADEGSKFVFGEEGLIDHPMAFKVRIHRCSLRELGSFHTGSRTARHGSRVAAFPPNLSAVPPRRAQPRRIQAERIFTQYIILASCLRFCLGRV